MSIPIMDMPFDYAVRNSTNAEFAEFLDILEAKFQIVGSTIQLVQYTPFNMV